jgi:esterase/lipase/predicted SnoaL-like aldol condensation-catalyzing enzyme
MKPHSIFLKFVLFFLIIFTFSHGQELIPIDITIDRDGVQLQGKFYISEGTERFPIVILLHGFPGGEGDVLGIGKKLSEVGYNALTFNYSGTYKSEGEFNFDNSQKDIETVFKFIHQPVNITKFKIDTTHIILGGYSYGGGMALTYAANHPKIKEVFSIAGNDHGEFMKEYNRNPEMQKGIDQMFDELKTQKKVVRFGPGGTVKEIAEMKIIESNPTYDLRYCVPLLVQKRILLISGWDDHSVSIENIILPLYRELKKKKAENINIVGFQDDHSFKNSRDEIAQIVINWLRIVPKHSSVIEDKKTIVRQFFREVVGQGNINVVNALLAPNCRYFDAGRVKTTNIPDFIDYLKNARLPFDSIDVKFDNIIAEGNWVAVRYTYHSVLSGELIVVPAMADFLIEDGKIIEMWRYIPARSKKK